jgi:predicted transcriptional regulator
VAKTLLEMAKDLAQSFVEAGQLSTEDMQNTLQKMYTTLTELKAKEASGVSTPVPASKTAPVDWRKSITKHAVTCLECGESFKQLSLRHLGNHGLDNRSYRTKYGIPPTQPLSARATTERRRQVVQEIRPWEKKQQLLQARKHNGHATPEPDVEAVHETAAKPDTGVPAQPKRQRKTTPKKTARKQSM